jgi:hypothetical protein
VGVPCAARLRGDDGHDDLDDGPHGPPSLSRRYAGPTLRWTSRQRQIASIVCVVAALVALFVLDVSWLFWVFVVASLALAAIDLWEKRRLDR